MGYKLKLQMFEDNGRSHRDCTGFMYLWKQIVQWISGLQYNSEFNFLNLKVKVCIHGFVLHHQSYFEVMESTEKKSFIWAITVKLKLHHIVLRSLMTFSVLVEKKPTTKEKRKKLIHLHSCWKKSGNWWVVLILLHI